ncbi:MAG: hypothetical protein AB7E95_06570 [Kiritimatiellales bacterium]
MAAHKKNLRFFGYWLFVIGYQAGNEQTADGDGNSHEKHEGSQKGVKED